MVDWIERCHDLEARLKVALDDFGSPGGAFGPRLQALVTVFSGMFELSRRDVVEALATILDVDLCLGSVQACCETVSEVIAPTVQEIHEDLKASPVVHVDDL